MSRSETEEADGDGELSGWMKYLAVKTDEEQYKIVELKFKGAMNIYEAEGRLNERGNIAMRMHEEGFGVADIIKATRLSKKEIKIALEGYTLCKFKEVLEFCKLDGKLAERFDITKRMHQEGFSVTDIAIATDVSEDEVKKTLDSERSFRMVTQYE
jgi:lambda repressor-like predicted transcriptional regulator